MSEWGRENNRTSARRGGWRLMLLVLVVGALGGIAAYHYLSSSGIVPQVTGLPPGTGTQEIEALRAERDGLQAEIERLRANTGSGGDGDDSGAGDGDAAARIARLEADLATREAEVRQAEARLTLAEQVASETNGRLDMAEKVTTELQGELDKALKETIPALTAQLAQRDAMLEKLDGELARLGEVEKQLAQARRQSARTQERADGPEAGQADGLRQRITQLEADIAARDATLEKLDRDAARVPQLEADIAARDAMLEKLDRDAARVPELEAALERARESLADRQAAGGEAAKSLDAALARIAVLENTLQGARDEVERLKARPESGAALAVAKSRVHTLETELAVTRQTASAREKQYRQLEEASSALVATLKEEIRRAREEIASLRQRLETAAATPRDSGVAAPEAERTDRAEPRKPDAPPRKAEPRDPLAVAKALQESAGLQDMDDARRDRIATRLIEGDCVADILSDEFGGAPAPALRDLTGALDSDC